MVASTTSIASCWRDCRVARRGDRAMYPIRVLPAGDSALIVSLPQVIDPETNAWCVAFAEAARDRWGSALRDVVVGYCTVTVYFDPLQVDPAWLEPELESF